MIAFSVVPTLLQPVLKAHYFFDVLKPLSGCYLKIHSEIPHHPSIMKGSKLRQSRLPRCLISQHNRNFVRGKKSQRACSPSQAMPRHRDHMRCAYSSISPFFVTVVTDLIQSAISVSGAGYAPETHRMAFPP
ncbi:BgTH12-01019 [Blumeria graminis f. sp. triticale]|uniref:BgTH12-01019 n=1 Tax=Blumeria graminis f. sp. triticale TaxID=1689686 RepID=A0A9W4DPD9_BLUGR|nr:BgTH12-01019 [Blumeria graminis f. sp. triticale]